MDYYDVLPRIVPADQWSEIRIHPRFDHAKIRRDDTVKVQVFADPVEGEEQISDNHEGNEEDQCPFRNAPGAQRVEIQEEVGVDQGGGAQGDQDRGVKLQNHRLNENEDQVYEREADRRE